ncbi:MAG: hypothetical protein Q9171_001897 [Xanthocarpia ochracea]
MADLGAETWIIHGTLMGWWWNRKIMPWDSDVDVHVSADTMHFLASYYNMTVHTSRTAHAPQGKNYMLEVNPKWINSSPGDSLNTIDARWIDMLSGVFIDITAVHRMPKNPSMMFCKDSHRYRGKQQEKVERITINELSGIHSIQLPKLGSGIQNLDDIAGEGFIRSQHLWHTRGLI